VEPQLPDVPAYLTGPALARWHELAPQLARAGILTALDADVLAGYCSAYGTYVWAQEWLTRTLPIVKGHRGVFTLSPFLRTRDRALELMVRIGAELGLSPSSRSRIHAQPTDGLDAELRAYLRG
jgi:P27 family predicted phage terminase small subunit